jgi:hypothetical protein
MQNVNYWPEQIMCTGVQTKDGPTFLGRNGNYTKYMMMTMMMMMMIITVWEVFIDKPKIFLKLTICVVTVANSENKNSNFTPGLFKEALTWNKK